MRTFADHCYVFASTVLFFLFSNLLLTGLVFLAGGHVAIAIVRISILLTIAFAAIWCRLTFRRGAPFAYLAALAAVLAVFAGSIALNRPIYDISYDGQTYHQEAVIQLSNGWNPVRQVLDPAAIGGENKWINYYPKGAWVNAAYLYLLTHEERAAKAVNIVLVLVSMALVYVALTDARILRPRPALAAALVLGANPISVYQSLSFYIDGQLMSLFLCSCAAFTIMASGRRKHAFAPAAFALATFVNLKFTAVVDAAAITAVFTLAAWMRENERLAVRTFLTGVASVAVGCLLIGASPYVTNSIRYHSPFYPLEGAGAIDLKPYNVPQDFFDRNAADIFFRSQFSRSSGAKGEGKFSVPKLPFTYDAEELAAFHYTDPNEGGFGPLFGGTLLVAGGLMLFCWFACRERDEYQAHKGRFEAALALMAAVFLITVVNPISSLARYVPQAYLLAVIPAILLLSFERFMPRVAGYLLLVILAFNTILVGSVYVAYNMDTSRAIAAELSTLAARSRTKPVLVYFNEFKSTRRMLDEAGVRYMAVADRSACKAKAGFVRVLPENTTEFCVP